MAEFGEALSEREIDVLECVARGLSNKETAEALNISPYTVKTHLRNIYAKLGATSRTEASLVGMEKGIIVAPNQSQPVQATVVQPVIQETPTDNDGETAVVEDEPGIQRNSLFLAIGLIAIIGLGVLWWFLNGRFLFGSSTTFDEIPLGNNWSVSTPLSQPHTHMATASVGQFIYQIGGENNAGVTDKVWVVDTNERTVDAGSPKPTAVSFTSAAVLYGEIYVVGGLGVDGNPTQVVEAYSPTNDGWLPIATLPEPLAGVVTIANEDAGTLYVLGGHNGETAVSTVYQYDLDQNSWTKLPDMDIPRANASGGLVNDQIIIVGGENATGNLPSCSQFNLEVETWTECADMKVARANAEAVSFISKLYVIGGELKAGEEQIVAEVYDPTTDTWESILGPTQLGEYDSWHGLGVGLVETKIYATSGLLDDTPSSDTYIYSPLSNRIFLPTSSSGQ